MAQYAYPISDISLSNWGTFWSKVDEEPYSDDDYSGSSVGVDGAYAIALLGSLTDPVVHTGHVLRVRVKDHQNLSGEFRYELLQGSTIIHAIKHIHPTGGYEEYSFTLSEAEAANITDYTNLRVRVKAVDVDPTSHFRVSWVRFQVPDISKVQNLKVKVSGVWTPVVAVKAKVSGAWVGVKVSARVNGEWKLIDEN